MARRGRHTVTFCLEYDRGTEPLGRISAKAGDYQRLERAWGIAFWLLVVVPGPRRERGVRAALACQGLAVATATRDGAQAPEEAVWAPLDAEGTRLRFAELAGWPQPAASIARVAEAARFRAGDPAFEGRG